MKQFVTGLYQLMLQTFHKILSSQQKVYDGKYDAAWRFEAETYRSRSQSRSRSRSQAKFFRSRIGLVVKFNVKTGIRVEAGMTISLSYYGNVN